jgi:hypothetical protein
VSGDSVLKECQFFTNHTQRGKIFAKQV